MITRQDERRVTALRSELHTMRLDGTCPIRAALDEVRDLLDTEIVALYTVAESLEGWELSRWDQIGGDPACGVLLREAIRTQARSVFYYDLLWPAADQRNRVIEARRWIDRETPGTWAASRMCREVFTPLGLEDHDQHRALLCDGPSLLAWFGTLSAEGLTRRQVRLLTSVIPAMQRRLTIERQLADAPRTADALRRALEQVGGAAFIVGRGGTIHECNQAGRALLDADRATVAEALLDAIAGRANAVAIELVPLAERGAPSHYLAILRHTSPEAQILTCVRICAERWRLTARQVEVLGLATRGLANATIAATLRVGERSVELHLTSIYDRAGVDSRAALIAHVLTAV